MFEDVCKIYKNFMNEDFVTYELAVKLEEKGYKQGYNVFGYKPVFSDENTVKFISDIGAYEKEYFGINIPCPTISEVLKWLREEKKIYIVIAVNTTLSTKDKIAYYYQIYFNSTGVGSDYYESEECYAQWEDCAIDSIKYVLDNLI